MLETSNNVGGIAQPLGLSQDSEKHPPRGCRYEHETMWWPCLITTSFTCKNADVRVLRHPINPIQNQIQHGFKARVGKEQPRMGPNGSLLYLFFMSLYVSLCYVICTLNKHI